MKILISGGAGYIGSHLVDYLNGKGHEIHIIDNFISGNRNNLKPDKTRGVLLHTIDIRDDKELITHFKANRYDVVFHLAAVSRTPWAIEIPREAYGINEMGSFNVLDAAKQSEVKKVVLASSNIVYASNTAYKYSKLGMENIARDFNDMYDLPTVCLRFSNVAGGDVTRQHPNNVLSSLAKSKKETGRITITGDGTQTRNFTNVMDICEALYLASGIPREVETFTGSPIYDPNPRGTEIDIMNPKVWELNDIAKMFNCPVDYIEDRKGDVKHLKMGIGPEKAKELLGFEAKIDLTEYINDYVNL